MKKDTTLNAINGVLPVIGIGLVIYYNICDTSCSSLRGTFLGADLKIIGIFFMVALLIMALPPVSRFEVPVGYLRTMMLAGAVGGEVLLIRFQIVHDTYCPFCLAFGACILLLFMANFMRMNRWLALGAFLAGIGAFLICFKGFVLPLYG